MHYIKLFVRYGIMLPVALLWTAWFWIIEQVYLGSKFVNEKGDVVIEDIVRKLE